VALTLEEFPAVNASVAGAALPPCLKVSGNKFLSAHYSEFRSIWRLARIDSTSSSRSKVSKRLVAYIEALIVLSLYGKPSNLRIAAIADAHFNTCLGSLEHKHEKVD
jgi:hypothetical protein